MSHRRGRSPAFKQFLLRVHPDHFRSLPKVHDENLQSIQLLNQFMDDPRSSSPQQRRVYFSAHMPNKTARGVPELKRFPLQLASGIEKEMRQILRECGVDVPDEPPPEPRTTQASTPSAPGRTTSQSPDGMDFGGGSGSPFGDFARKSTARRRKRVITTLDQFLAYLQEDGTREIQQQRLHAWRSIESIKGTLGREFGIHQVTTSCGWASVHLNASLMALLKTIRKLSKSSPRGISFLSNVAIDISSDPSHINEFDEYKVLLNVADVPVQWVEVLEKVDDRMVTYMQYARQTLQSLQTRAQTCLGGITIRRGLTCSPIAYRGFLQEVISNAEAVLGDPTRIDSSGDHVIETLSLVVEDSASDCLILDDASIRVPSCHSADQIIHFVDDNRDRIRQQVSKHAADRAQFALLMDQLKNLVGVTSVVYSEAVPLAHINCACMQLVGHAMSSPSHCAKLRNAIGGHTLRIDRTFGISQDGSLTISVDWNMFS